MLFWIVAAVVAVVLFAFAWWLSGRARPDTSSGTQDRVMRAHSQTETKDLMSKHRWDGGNKGS